MKKGKFVQGRAQKLYVMPQKPLLQGPRIHAFLADVIAACGDSHLHSTSLLQDPQPNSPNLEAVEERKLYVGSCMLYGHTVAVPKNKKLLKAQ